MLTIATAALGLNAGVGSRVAQSRVAPVRMDLECALRPPPSGAQMSHRTILDRDALRGA